MNSVIFLLLGFILLFFGGEILVRSSVSLAVRLKLSTLFIGMTVVSLATSAPELFVSLEAIFKESSNIALGNAIGSNIANITLVLGFTAVVFRVKISKETLNINYPMMFLSSVFLGVTLYFFDGIPVLVGYFFVALLILFTVLLTTVYRRGYLEFKNNNEYLDNTSDPLYKSLVLLILGVLLLKYGADFLVNATTDLAKDFGISDRIIAVTIVAIGTSIPELATSIIAAFKKEDNLAIGNLIGSNMFNILAVLGVTAVIKEIKIDDIAILSFDYFSMMLITFIVGLFIYIFSKKLISRKEGSILLMIYFYYMYQNLLVVI